MPADAKATNKPLDVSSSRDGFFLLRVRTTFSIDVFTREPKAWTTAKRTGWFHDK